MANVVAVAFNNALGFSVFTPWLNFRGGGGVFGGGSVLTPRSLFRITGSRFLGVGSSGFNVINPFFFFVHSWWQNKLERFVQR
jgi:hypothetical protein